VTFTPAPNLLVEYRGNVGTIKFVSDEYLTFCMAPKNDKMIGDLCIVVYRYCWDEIKLLQGHHRQ